MYAYKLPRRTPINYEILNGNSRYAIEIRVFPAHIDFLASNNTITRSVYIFFIVTVLSANPAHVFFFSLPAEDRSEGSIPVLQL